MLDAADLQLGAARPDPEAAYAQRVALPDRWFLTRRRAATQGWYRLRVDLPAAQEPLALLLTGARLNVEVFLNGSSLGRVGRFAPPIARNPSAPLYYRLPPTTVREGRNTIEVHLATTPGFPGRLEPIWLGRDADLRPVFERWALIDPEGPRLAILFAVILGVILVGQGITGRQDRAASAFLGSAALCMAISGLGYFVSEIPLPSRVWEWIVGCLTHWASLLLVLAAHRFLKLERRKLERRLLALYVAASIGLGVVPHLLAFSVWVSWLVLAIGVYLYLLFLLIRGVRYGQLHPSVPVVAFLAIGPWVGTAGLGFFGVAAALAWLVTARTFHQMRETDLLNRALGERVAAREAELRKSYDKLRDLERARTIAAERERLMRDMHDGTGGQLASALAVARSGDGDRDALIRILQETLDDLRLTIESLDPGARDIPSVLGMMRAPLERRLGPAGLRLVWQVGEAGTHRPLTSEAALHVIRIVQEAVTNTIKHADADKVTIQTRTTPEGGLLVEVRDDGHGATDFEGGRGVGNLQGRAAAMGGRVEIESDGEGTLVRLVLPESTA